MSVDTYRSNLGEWENEPVVQDQVIAYMEGMRQPLLLREIYRPLGLPRYIVNRVLGRLHAKGVLNRYKIPDRWHRPNLTPGNGFQRAVTRHCFLYSFAEMEGV